MMDYSVAEEILSGVQTASVDCQPFAVAPEIVSGVAEFKQLLHVHLFYACGCKYLQGLNKISPDSSSLKRCHKSV